MRINVYTEELPDSDTPLPHVEVVTADYVSSRTGEPMTNYGLRVYLKSHKDLHFVPPRDDDRSAVTFWCGSKSMNLYRFVDMLKQVVETDNLDRPNPWAHIPKHYEGRWRYDYDDKNSTFFVHCNGHGICQSEDSEVCGAICQAHNAWLGGEG